MTLHSPVWQYYIYQILGECSVILVGSIIILLCHCKQCNSYTSAPVALFIMQSENTVGL